jgi:hypothetical protein
MLKITYYLDVISSWCHWSEPAWALLKGRYNGSAEFQWKIALMDVGSAIALAGTSRSF